MPKETKIRPNPVGIRLSRQNGPKVVEAIRSIITNCCLATTANIFSHTDVRKKTARKTQNNLYNSTIPNKQMGRF